MEKILKRIKRRVKWHWWDIIHKLRPVHWVLLPCRDAAQILLRSNSVIAQMIYSMGYEEEERQFLRRTLGPGMTVFDLGANVGWYTILMAQAVGPRGAVHAFEPYPDTFYNLQLNVALNKLSNITLNCLALSQESGTVPFHVFPEGYDAFNSMGAKKRLGRLEAVQQISVPTITLDEYCREKNLRSLDFLKLDVEGMEEFVLRGGQQILQQSPHLVILIELNDKGALQCGSSVATVMQMLQELGFSPHQLTPQGVPVALSESERENTCRGQNLNYNFVFLSPRTQVSHHSGQRRGQEPVVR
jgi:FkbM family methyltransferase